MFVLVDLERTIEIEPQFFGNDIVKIIETQINQKLSNKVLHNVGLCIVLDEITHINSSILHPMKPTSYTKVNFKYLVFRPKMRQVLEGKVRSCCHEGVYVTLGFFEDILIPCVYLPKPSRFSEVERVWIWEYMTDDGSTHDLFMDIEETIRFRVIDEIFEEVAPIINIPDSSGGISPLDVRPPYRLVGAINEEGLGVDRWWCTPQNEPKTFVGRRILRERVTRKQNRLKQMYTDLKEGKILKKARKLRYESDSEYSSSSEEFEDTEESLLSQTQDELSDVEDSSEQSESSNEQSQDQQSLNSSEEDDESQSKLNVIVRKKQSSSEHELESSEQQTETQTRMEVSDDQTESRQKQRRLRWLTDFDELQSNTTILMCKKKEDSVQYNDNAVQRLERKTKKQQRNKLTDDEDKESGEHEHSRRSSRLKSTYSFANLLKGNKERSVRDPKRQEDSD